MRRRQSRRRRFQSVRRLRRYARFKYPIAFREGAAGLQLSPSPLVQTARIGVLNQVAKDIIAYIGLC